MRRTVSSRLTADVLAPAAVELQIAVTGARLRTERLEVRCDGAPLEPVEVTGQHGGRLHLLQVPAGRLEVDYRASVDGDGEPVPATLLDRTTFLRPSRYAESDRLAALAAAELGHVDDPAALLTAARDWVARRLAYVSGSSRGTDSAVDTALAGAGVCRDFAHLAVALLRARDVPARVASVYAPGLSPMDFHLVVEGLVDRTWYVVDPTLLAPRQSLVRIATGRDAADTAFLSSYGGEVRLDELEVSAVVDGVLPLDDLDALVQLAQAAPAAPVV